MRRRRITLPGSAFVEANGKLRAVLIEEGRSRNGNVWTRPILERIAAIADGVPVNVYDFSPDGSGRKLSHWEFIRQRLPPAIARLLPERLGDAQVATVRRPVVEETNGKARVVADLEELPARAGLLRRIVDAARRMAQSAGISIHVPADGIAWESNQQGDRVPTSLSRIVGFDVVSVPSAGGRILPVLESLAGEGSMKNWLARLLRLVPEDQKKALEALAPKGKIEKAADLLVDANAAFVEAFVEAMELDDVAEESLAAVLEALVRTVPEEDPKPAAKPKRRPPVKHRAADPDDGDDPAAVALEAIQTAQREQADELRAMRVENGRLRLTAIVEAAKLPKTVAEFATKHLGAALEQAGKFDELAAVAFVEGLKTGLGKLDAPGGSLIEGSPMSTRISQDWSDGERAEVALEALIAREQYGELVAKDGKKSKVPAFRSIKQAYQVITGDVLMEGGAFIRGRRRPGGVLESVNWEANQYMQSYLARTGSALEAAIVTSGFPNLLANVINKRLAREYAQLAHLWRLVATTTPVSDFKARSIVRLGEYGALPTVNENAPYVDLALPTEEEVTATIAKKGGLAPISWESVVNDDLRAFSRIPGMLARAAERTLNSGVWGKLLNNTNWDGDGVAVFHAATHANLTAAAYSFAGLEGARLAMTRQKDPDGIEAGRVIARNVCVGPAIYDAVYADLFSDGKPNLDVGTRGTGTDDNPGQANTLRSKHGWQLHEVHEFDAVAGSETDTIIAASPAETEIMEVGFLNGNEMPEIFVSDLERVGSFFDADRITYKVRHVHDSGVVVDYRGLHRLEAP